MNELDVILSGLYDVKEILKHMKNVWQKLKEPPPFDVARYCWGKGLLKATVSPIYAVSLVWKTILFPEDERRKVTRLYIAAGIFFIFAFMGRLLSWPHLMFPALFVSLIFYCGFFAKAIDFVVSQAMEIMIWYGLICLNNKWKMSSPHTLEELNKLYEESRLEISQR